jgi:hypothetical protein
MRSARVTPNTVATPNDYNALVSDASGAAKLLPHQMYGSIEFPNNPTNGQTLTLDINGTNVVITFVTSIGSTAGNVKIQSTNLLTLAALLQLLQNPTITNANQVAIGLNTSANVTLLGYIDWMVSGSNLIPSSYNTILYSPVTSFSISTTVTGAAWYGYTMSLLVEPGIVYVNGTEVYFAGGVTGTVTAPVSHPRIDMLSIDNTGALNWTTGTENASPVAPTYPANQIPICELYNVVGETVLFDNANQQSGQGYILNDVRPFLLSPINLAAVPDSILPATTNTYNLGSLSEQWQYLYAQAVYINGVQLADRFGGTGADGALTVTSGTTTIAASSNVVVIKNYTSISITGTAYVQCTTSVASGSAFILKSQGNVTFTSSATPMLDASGCGGSGGAGGGNGTAGSTGTAGTLLMVNCGPGFGALVSGEAGGTLSTGFGTPNLNLNKYPSIFAGGGGGGGNGSGTGASGGVGGLGGGALVIECAGAWNFTTASGISVLGKAGGSGGGGIGSSPGGSGGSGFFLALYNTLTANSGTVSSGSVAGGSGSGGTAGGGGAGAAPGSAAVSTTAGAGGAGFSLIALNVDY